MFKRRLCAVAAPLVFLFSVPALAAPAGGGIVKAPIWAKGTDTFVVSSQSNLPPGPAGKGGLQVTGWTPHRFATIQAALNAARTSPRLDVVIRVMAGTYTENLVVRHNKRVHLVALQSVFLRAADEDQPVIRVASDCLKFGECFGRTTVEGFRFVQHLAPDVAFIEVDNTPVPNGKLHGSANVEIRGCDFDGQGRGVTVRGWADVTIEDSDLHVTGYTSSGAGVNVVALPGVAATACTEATRRPHVTVRNSDFQTYYAKSGGAVYAHGADITLQDVDIRNSTSKTNLVELHCANAEVSGTWVEDNEAAGFLVDAGSKLTLRDSFVQDNKAMTDGVGIWTAGDTTIDNTYFARQIACVETVLPICESGRPASAAIYHAGGVITGSGVHTSYNKAYDVWTTATSTGYAISELQFYWGGLWGCDASGCHAQ